jgi:putative glutamine amidotransferase
VRPVIGVTANPGATADEYVAALRAAGADPVVLVNDASQVEADLMRLDGVVVSGGPDVDPAEYGQVTHPQTEIAPPARDAYERALVVAARERDVPLLAICRGMQIANVAFGGTLIQHVPDVAGEAIVHQIDGVRGLIASHVVEIEADAQIARVLGTTRLATSARHHQAVDAVAPDLRAVASTPDGIIEALEARWPARYWLAVQWHPESTFDDGGPSAALFRSLVDAASLSRPERASTAGIGAEL